MKNKKSVQCLFYLTIFLLFFLSSCTKFEEPGLIYNPTKVNNTKDPVITQVIPGGAAVAGVREITILGENFIPSDTVWVLRDSVRVPRDTAKLLFGDQTPLIKSISNNQIVVYRPQNYGQLVVKYIVPNADAVSNNINYDVERPIRDLVGYNDLTPFVMELDQYDTAWVCASRAIYKVDPSGINRYPFLTRTRLTSVFLKFLDAKFGRGGFLYLLVNGRSNIYRLNRNDTSSAPSVYTALPGNPKKFDFDENGNIYVGLLETGATNGLYKVDTNGLASSAGDYPAFAFVEVRVIKDASANKYVYAADGTSLWRSQILDANGTLGNKQLIVRDSIPQGCLITSFNVREDGQIYLALRNHPRDYLFVLESNGSLTPFYKANILPVPTSPTVTPVDQILWGYNSKNLYINRSQFSLGAIRVYRMGMEEKGAPNLGRDLH